MAEAGVLRRLYDWVIHWAHTPYGGVALFLLAFTESSFFPVPPDVLLIALALGAPLKSFRFAAICTAGSVLGGMFGYYIGLAFFELVGYRILEFYGFMDKFNMVREMYGRYDVWFVGAAGFTPIHVQDGFREVRGRLGPVARRKVLHRRGPHPEIRG